MDHHINTFNATRVERCLEELILSAEDARRAADERSYYISLGRRYGATWEQMGKALGITGDAVRMSHKRARKAAERG